MIPFDVVIPAHDAAATVADAVRSAREQAPAPSSITVVADACSDDTAARARAAGADVVEVDVRGAAAARNLGVARGRAPWIAFLDADDLWLDGWLAAVTSAIARAPDAIFVYGRYREITGDGALLGDVDVPAPEGDPWLSLFVEQTIKTSAAVVRRDAFARAGGFDESLQHSEDWLLWLHLMRRGCVARADGVRVLYRRSDGSLMRDPARFERARADGLAALEAALRMREVPGNVERSARARLARDSAARFLSSGYHARARGDVWHALRFAPRSIELWAMAAATALPTNVVQRALRARRLVRSLLS